MKKLIQTRLSTNHQDPIEEHDNSFATVIACLMGLDNPEDAFQVQEHYPQNGDFYDARWSLTLSLWLDERGWDWGSMEGHLYDNSLYIVAGPTFRGTTHVCIYKNGELYYYPHPDGTCLMYEEAFEFFEKKKILQ